MNLTIHELFVMRYREVATLMRLRYRSRHSLSLTARLRIHLAIRRQEERIAHIERLMSIMRGKLSRHRALFT